MILTLETGRVRCAKTSPLLQLPTRSIFCLSRARQYWVLVPKFNGRNIEHTVPREIVSHSVF